MKPSIKRRAAITVGWLAFMCIVVPSLVNGWMGDYSLLRFDPRVSSDYNCIFVEGKSRPSFAVPWLSRSTPIDYLRIRYTPNSERQPYGIMFVDPGTLAYEAHSGFAQRPTRMAGRLDSPVLVRDWMRSQAWSAQAPSHDGDALEIHSAILALSRASDLEHFELPANLRLSHFQIGAAHTSLPSRGLPRWPFIVSFLIPLWFRAYEQKGQSNQGAVPPHRPVFGSHSDLSTLTYPISGLHRFTLWRFRRRVGGGVAAGTSKQEVLAKLGKPRAREADEHCDVWIYEVGRTRRLDFSYFVSFHEDKVIVSWWRETNRAGGTNGKNRREVRENTNP